MVAERRQRINRRKHYISKNIVRPPRRSLVSAGPGAAFRAQQHYIDGREEDLQGRIFFAFDPMRER